MSTSGITGTFLGPRSPGTAYVMLHHYMGEIDGVSRSWGFQRGGTGGLAEAYAGVLLEIGEELDAEAVSSSLDPKRTFSKLTLERTAAKRLPANSTKVHVAVANEIGDRQLRAEGTVALAAVPSALNY